MCVRLTERTECWNTFFVSFVEEIAYLNSKQYKLILKNFIMWFNIIIIFVEDLTFIGLSYKWRCNRQSPIATESTIASPNKNIVKVLVNTSHYFINVSYT
jgi:hypothetical protein